jgi:hypothetical protein
VLRSSWWLLVAAAVTVGFIGHRQFTFHPDLTLGAAWWFGGLLLLGAAAWLGDRGAPERESRRWSRADVLAIAAVTALAIAMRVWRVGEYPPPDGFGFEELQTGSLAYGASQSFSLRLEFLLTNFLPSITFRLFGPSSYALRAPFVAAAILAPIFLFVALRRAVALPAAWTAAMLLAGSRWAASAARFADEIFLPILTMSVGAWLLVRAAQRQRLTSTLAFAVVASELFYAYHGYWVFPFILLGAAALVMMAYRWRGQLPARSVRHLALATAVWAILLGPGVVSSVYHGQLFSEPFQRHGAMPFLQRAAAALERARGGVKLFFTDGDTMPYTNLPGRAMTDPLTGALLTLSVVAALARWRDPWRWLMLATVLLPFAAVAVITINFNTSRYFVLLVPLFVLTGFFLDDLLRWRLVPRAWAVGGLLLMVGWVTAVNFRDLHRLIDEPAVRASFVNPVNSVLAAIHRTPAGARVVLLTQDASAAFEPSDYRWLATQVTGARAESLPDALTLRDDDSRRAIHWITQGPLEAEILPAVVALACPDVQSSVRRAGDPMATVGVASVSSNAGCSDPKTTAGLRGRYVLFDQTGQRVEFRQIDPVLMAWTVPWRLGFHLGRAGNGMQVTWEGWIVPQRAGEVLIGLDLFGAAGRWSIAGSVLDIAGDRDRWQAAQLPISLADATPLRTTVEMTVVPGCTRPRVRLHWAAPGAEIALIPPANLRPVDVFGDGDG